MKMSLDQTWKNCLSMWRWIAKEVRKRDKTSILALKKKWAAEHCGLGAIHYCFLCDYAGWEVYGSEPDCAKCPAKRIDCHFDCEDTEYDWSEEPIKFYNKLVSLNRKRLKATRRHRKKLETKPG